MNVLKNKRQDGGIKLSMLSVILSLLTTIVFHFPFFRYISENVDRDFNGTAILVSLALMMFTANYFAYYLVLWLGRIAGRILSALAFIGNAVTLYFINTYDVIVDDSMMGNVFNTNVTEATSYWSASALLYIILTGILPCLLVLIPKIKYGSWKRFLTHIGSSLAVIAVLAFANMSNWMWVDKNAPVMGSLILPWSYVVNTFRYYHGVHERNKEEIRLEDATMAGNGRKALVVIIGESARRDHFSLYGYQRLTNPLLEKVDGLKHYNGISSATYTTEGLKAILSYKDCSELYEVLPNYLFRTGVDVKWRTSNWGEPPLHIEDFKNAETLAGKYGMNKDYDDVLTHGIKDLIDQSDSSRIAIFLHTSASHGPSYSKKYPPEFEEFSPVANTVEMSKCPIDELINAYDNTILYTDYLINSVIDQLKEVTDRDCCMLFVSDHGESLGENGLYMHGVPISIAPACQYEIPVIAWTSDPTLDFVDRDPVTQPSIFHSSLHFLDIESPVYDSSLDLFKPSDVL